MIGTCSMMTAQQDNPFFGKDESEGETTQDNGGPGNAGSNPNEQCPNDDCPPVAINSYLPALFAIGAGVTIYVARRQKSMGERSKSL